MCEAGPIPSTCSGEGRSNLQQGDMEQPVIELKTPPDLLLLRSSFSVSQQLSVFTLIARSGKFGGGRWGGGG